MANLFGVCLTDVVRYLIDVCRDKSIVDLSNAVGRSCLHIAAMTNNLDLVSCLLRFNANLNLVVRLKVRDGTPIRIIIQRLMLGSRNALNEYADN